MDATRDLQIRIFKSFLIFNGCIGIVGSFFIKPPLPFILGLVFGSLIAILNFRLAALALEKAMTFTPRRAEVHVASRYMIRYFIIAVVFFVSIKVDHINLLGTFIGIITFKFVILYKEVFGNKEFIKKILRRREVE